MLGPKSNEALRREINSTDYHKLLMIGLNRDGNLGQCGVASGELERYRFAKEMVDKTNAIGGAEGSRGRVCGKVQRKAFWSS